MAPCCAAVGWCGCYAVTVAVGGIRFVSPIRTSDLVPVHTKLVHTGTTSMHFAIDVQARDPMGGEERLCTHCVIVFVAMDQVEGKPTAVPSWTPETEDDKRLAEYALKVMEPEAEVRFEFTTGKSPGKLTDGDDYVYVAMPIALE